MGRIQLGTYNQESYGDNAVLGCHQPLEKDLQPILREEVEIAVAALKNGKSAGVDQQKLFKLAGRPLLMFNRDL